MPESEQLLSDKLALANEGTPEYCSVLADLAELKLSQGKAQDAQELFKQLQQHRQNDLEQLPEEELPASASSSEDWDTCDWEPPRLASASTFSPQRHTEPRGKQQSSSSNGVQQQRKAPPAATDRWRAGADDVDRPSTPGDPDMPHVVELYRLTHAVRTSHLEEFLLEYAVGGCAPTIHWVDEAHALAVFPTQDAAQGLLDSQQDRFAVRPYSKASLQARDISQEALTPPRAVRPKTTTAVARRLIGAALGTNAVRDRHAERELAAMRQEKKQQRQQRQEQLQEAWEQG